MTFFEPDLRHGGPSPKNGRSDLTNREHKIMYLLASGKRDHEIGSMLGISPRLVQKYIVRILKKNGVVPD